tara:strand:- start:735 stop:1358 length:624 start_codon:yes stop_codon:yes gene_type:complete
MQFYLKLLELKEIRTDYLENKYLGFNAIIKKPIDTPQMIYFKKMCKIIKSTKFNSKNFFKNKNNAWCYLSNFSSGWQQYAAVCAEYKAPEEFNKIYKCQYDIMRNNYYLKKSCKASDLYEFIDKYIGDIMLYELNKSRPLYTNITNIKNDLSTHDCAGFIRYSMIYTKTINNKIDKMSSRFLKRLYNPHTELGRNYAMKNIEWAFEE